MTGTQHPSTERKCETNNCRWNVNSVTIKQRTSITSATNITYMSFASHSYEYTDKLLREHTTCCNAMQWLLLVHISIKSTYVSHSAQCSLSTKRRHCHIWATCNTRQTTYQHTFHTHLPTSLQLHPTLHTHSNICSGHSPQSTPFLLDDEFLDIKFQLDTEQHNTSRTFNKSNDIK